MSAIEKAAERAWLPFRLDMRALALLRIGAGCVVLLDLLFRLPDLRAHYSDQGLFPLVELFQTSWHPARFSLHTSTGMWQGQALWFCAAIAAALALAFGWRTRLASFISWLLLLSLQNRNPMILQGGDDMLRLLLFWGMFLPWGRRWSVDAANTSPPAQPPGPDIFKGAAGVGYLMLVFSVYFFSALLKTGPEWTTDYTALYYALSLDQIALPAGKLLYPHFELMKGLTFMVWWLELLLPLLLLVPTRSYLPRMVFIIGIALLHLGIAISLYVGLFFVIGWVTLLGLLPPFVMDRIELALKAGATRWQKKLNAFRLARLPFLPGKVTYPRRPVVEVLLWGAVLYSFFWNLDNTPASPVGISGRYKWAGQVLRLDQNWGMFAPEVFKDDGWYIFEGRTAGGEIIDLNQRGMPVQYHKPASIVSMFSSDRWRKYYENYLFVAYSFLRVPHCKWAIREWNEHHQPHVTQLEVVYMKEISLPGYKVDGPRREVLCTCGDAGLPQLTP